MAIKLDERDNANDSRQTPKPGANEFFACCLLDQLNPKHPLLKLVRAESLHLPRTHEKEVKHLKQHTRFASHPSNRKKARRAVKRLKTIAGRLLREIERQMNEAQQ